MGIRGRLLLVVLFATALSGSVLIPILRDLWVPRLERSEGEQVLSRARLAAARAPADAGQWGDWVRDLSRSLEGITVRLLSTEPGRPEFLEEARRVGVPLDLAVEAFLSGEALARVPPSLPEEPPPGKAVTARPWMALVRLDGPGTRPSLLVMEQTPRSQTPPSVWTLVVLYSLLVAALGVLGGLVAGYFLIVRPISATASRVRRRSLWPSEDDLGDLALLSRSLDDLSKRLAEERRRADRLTDELERNRADLRGAKGRLIQAEKLASVGQLAAGIAHEIGNPIGIALGLSEILRDGVGDPAQAKAFAGQVHASILRVHGILRDLLDFARPSREEGARAEVRACVDGVRKLVRAHKRFEGIDLRTHLPADPLWVEIRPSQLQQVLLNLWMNAADAMEGRGTLTTTARREGRRIEIEVRDTGPGIPEETLPRIFDPFFSTKPPGEGTGLGLAICAQILQVYGGDITAGNAPDRGAVFQVRLWDATEAEDPGSW
ncbi:MAG TPA: ATP-binding protein [Myxococcota bacterium]|nr:ATP-binding protein [Myxococcota bacterium]